MSVQPKAHAELVAARSTILASCNPAEIALMQRDELLALQRALGYGETWGEWVFPELWLPPTVRSLSKRRIALSIEDGVSDCIWTELLRFALTRCLVRGPKAGIAACTTVRGELEAGVRVAPLLRKNSASPERFWSSVTIDEIRAVSKSADGLVKSIGYFFNIGYLRDCPVGRPLDNGITERNRRNEPVPTHDVESGKQWQPLPDDFVGECGHRVIWLIRHVGPTLIGLLKAVAEVNVPPPCADGESRAARPARWSKDYLSKHRNQVIRDWDWIGPDGRPIHELPFEFILKTRIGHSGNSTGAPTMRPFSWPLRGYGDLLNFVSTLQSCHAWLLCLLNGPRASSVLGLEESCLGVGSDGAVRITGLQYKTRGGKNGRARDWPAPELLVQALRQQIELAGAVKRIAARAGSEVLGPHIFVSMHKGTFGAPLRTVNSNLTLLAKRFNLGHLLGKNERVHVHRFRKTIARLIALSLTSAQTILVDLFGHSDPEMSLRRYILSDKLIMADVQRIQRELIVLLGKEAVETASELGGKMGARVRDAIATFKRVERKSQLDPKDVFELAEALTLDGTSWAVVMPGIICALPMGATGPCAARQGTRDPANCQSECDHQLLLAFNKAECSENVAWIVSNLERAVASESVSIDMWVGQLQNWLYRWKDVYDTWKEHELVRRYCGAHSQSREVVV